MASTYQDAVEQLLSLADFERKARANESPDFHLLRTSMLLESLGNPQDRVPSVHVAGSKGKGSTCAMIAGALSRAGLRTGMFISPHLHRMTERFTIDGEEMPQQVFVALFNEIWPHAEAIRRRGDSGTVSVFEFQTALAFLHFARSHADVMVIEVGLGGRLDSTNVITPLVSVITPVGFDHVAVLGDTIEKIAFEKAGIIKPGVPVVVGRQPAAAYRTIAGVAERLSAPVRRSDTLTVESEHPNGFGPQLLELLSADTRYRVSLPLLGAHQVENAQTAIAAIETIAGVSDFAVAAADIESGIASVIWPGRVQLVDVGPPMVIVDGAHNEDSAKAFAAALRRHFGPIDRPFLILGSTKGHDERSVVQQLTGLKPRIVVTTSRHPKAVEPEYFAETLLNDRIHVEAVTGSTREALEYARANGRGKVPIVAAGSLFVSAEIIEEVTGIEPEIYPDLVRSVASNPWSRIEGSRATEVVD